MNEIDQESIVLNGGVSEHSRAPFWNRDGTEPTPRNGGLMFLPFYWISFICIFFFFGCELMLSLSPLPAIHQSDPADGAFRRYIVTCYSV